MRPSWDKIFMDYAESIALRSPDEKYKIGCVITNQDGTRILSHGYNGDEEGGTNERESMETGCSGFIHAEENALLKLDYTEPYKRVYVTYSPCRMCAKKLINAHVDEIIYSKIYDPAVLVWLKTHKKGKHIKLRQL